MNHPLLLKLAAIGALMTLLLIPLGMVRGLVAERAERRDTAVADIARSSSGPQRVLGPMLLVPYARTIQEYATDPRTHERSLIEREERGLLYFLPEHLRIDGTVSTEIRHRGIYEARLFHLKAPLTGYFSIPVDYGIERDLERYRFGTPFIALGVGDIRGIESVPSLRLGEHALEFSPGTQGSLLGEGVHAPLPAHEGTWSGKIDFALALAVQGTSALQFVPVGRETSVRIHADWPHPGFSGDFLPAEREIDDTGFTATWNTTFFSTNVEELLRACVTSADCRHFAGPAFGFSLVDPVDQYLRTDRSLKYALLFVGLGFAGFFVFEVLKRLALHPVQYTLVGLALALFYLLLLSLSEHIGFGRAYAISATACVALIGTYTASVLRSRARAGAFSAALATQYALLYGLLGSEDYALLMGSMLLFALLAAVMVLTRAVDWRLSFSSA